jgi:DNA-directed RNA polymerase specialized sigma24 family protein
MTRGDNRSANREAIVAVLEAQCNGLLAIAMRLTRWDRARSEDLVQTAFMRALSAGPEAASWTYLRQALMSAFLDEQRSFWSKWVRTTDALREIPREDPIVERIQAGTTAHALRDHMPEDEYLTLFMWAEGYSANETCKRLRITRPTHAHVLARAKKTAARWLQRHGSPQTPNPVLLPPTRITS